MVAKPLNESGDNLREDGGGLNGNPFFKELACQYKSTKDIEGRVYVQLW